MKNKFKFLATMLIGILLSVNLWGADVTHTWTLPFSTTTNEWRTVNNAQFGACNSSGALNGGSWTNISNGSYLNLPANGYFLVKVPITSTTTSFTLNANIFAWASSKYAVKTVTITYYTSKNTTEANICNGSTTTSGCYNVSEEITLPNSYVVTSNGTLFIKIAMQQGNDGFEALSVTTKSGSTKADVTLTPTQNARNLTVDDIVEDLSTWYTISPAAYDGTITYTSSNEDIFAEDEGAGYAFSTGTCNLYVNAPETSNYKAANCTISVTVTAPAVKHNVNWHVSGVVTTDEVAEGATITFPATPTVPDACSDKVFYGWAKSAIDGEAEDAPTVYTSETMGTEDVDFYAVFADKDGSGENGWEKVTTVAGFTPGTYVFGYESNDGFIPMRKETDKSTINVNTYLRAGTTAGSSTSTTLTLTASTVVTDYAVTIGAGSVDGTITIHNGTNYIGVGSSSGNIHNEETAEDWKPEISNEVLILKHNTSTTYIFSYNTSSPRFAAYTSSQGKPSFYKWTSNTSYSGFVTTCKACESEVTVTKSACENGSFTVSKETVCADDGGGSVTVTCTPNEHYHVSAVTATVGSVTGSGNSYTVSGITAATEIAVTFAIDQQITVTWNVNGTAAPQILWPGEHVTALPEAPAVMPTCANTFMGWSTETLVGEGHNAPTDLFNKIEDLPEITADVTFNAVFATAVGGGTVTHTMDVPQDAAISGYEDRNFTDDQGYIWSGKFNGFDNGGEKFWSLSKHQNNYHISSPTFAGNVSSIKFWVRQTASDTRSIILRSNTSTARPTESDMGLTAAVSQNAEVQEVTITPTTQEFTQFNIYVSDGMGFRKIQVVTGGGVTYSNYVTTCATYTVTWMSNGYQIRVDENKAPGTVLTAPTVSEVRGIEPKAACNDHLVGWVPFASTTNPKVKQDTAPDGMVGQQVTVTGNVVYHAVYADVAGE